MEDEASLRGLLSRVLAGAGFSVLEAGHGEEALEQVRGVAGQLSLVITDIHMPVMDGLALGRALRACSPATPILFITGRESQDPDFAESIGDCGSLLRKPFTADGLLEAVALLSKEPSGGRITA